MVNEAQKAAEAQAAANEAAAKAAQAADAAVVASTAEAAKAEEERQAEAEKEEASHEKQVAKRAEAIAKEMKAARVDEDAKVEAARLLAEEASAAAGPAVDPTTATAHKVRVGGGKGASKEQTSSLNDHVRQLEDGTAVQIGAGVSSDMRPRVPYGVSL